jgi:ferredoxin
MTVIHYFTGSGHSFAVAKKLSQLVGCETREITGEEQPAAEETISVVVFPVYCQNIPTPVKNFLKTIAADHVALIATYGQVSYGNVLYEAQRLVRGTVIAGACIPTGHTFLDGPPSFPTEPLRAIAERIHAPKEATIPKTHKNPLSDLFPGLRSRMGVTIERTDACNGCGICEQNCPTGAIRRGKPGRKCIRCLRCVTNCPRNALRYRNRWILKIYLNCCHKGDTVLYLSDSNGTP